MQDPFVQDHVRQHTHWLIMLRVACVTAGLFVLFVMSESESDVNVGCFLLLCDVWFTLWLSINHILTQLEMPMPSNDQTAMRSMHCMRQTKISEKDELIPTRVPIIEINNR
jgi:hypothetical protein